MISGIIDALRQRVSSVFPPGKVGRARARYALIVAVALATLQVLRRRRAATAVSASASASGAADAATAAAAAAAAAGPNASSSSVITKAAEIGYDHFLKLVERDDGVVRAVEVGADLIRFKVKRGGHETQHFTRPITVHTALLSTLRENGVSFSKAPPSRWSGVLPFVIAAVPVVYLGIVAFVAYKIYNDSIGTTGKRAGNQRRKKSGGNSGGSGRELAGNGVGWSGTEWREKERAHPPPAHPPTPHTHARAPGPSRGVLFRHVAGADAARESVSEIVRFLKDPRSFRRLGARCPRGLLLVGPPGTGKTMLARAMANEAGVPFFYCSGSDFVEVFAGRGASRVRDLFSRAKAAAPSIVFVDELDALGKVRGVGGMRQRNETTRQKEKGEKERLKTETQNKHNTHTHTEENRLWNERGARANAQPAPLRARRL